MPIDINVSYNQIDCLGQPFGAEGIHKLMQKYRVDISILVSGLAIHSDFKRGNEQLRDAIAKDDSLYGYLVLNPNYPDASIEMMRTMMSRKKFLAAAFYVGSSRPYPNVDDCRDILNAYRRFTKPVYIYAPHSDAVMAALQMAQEFPGIKFILGSMGGCDWKRAMLSEKLLNVVLETSGSFDAEKIEEAAAVVGAHRILFGSGAPYTDPVAILALIQSSNLSRADMDQILNANARKLFDL